ncbi:hypothetical protein Adt_42645 [Abeliophyllum distichum]|uniref:Uncharacterized protein n=1 Tax=Abeliophyllum distichum TaxID=126358 RepID=A0ABD1PV03_9LAMI
MSIILRDISALTNIPPVGTTISPAMIVTHTPPSIKKQIFCSYKQLQTLHNNTVAEPNHVECVAFIHYWFYKFVICVSSIKPSIGYLPIPNELSHGKLLNLGSFILAALYRGIATHQDQQDLLLLPMRASIPSPFASHLPIIFNPPVVLIIEKPQSSESLAQTAKRTQSSPVKGHNALKKAVLAYTSFMDKDISRASVDSQKKFLAHLSEDLAYALKHPTAELSASIRLTLRGIHQEVSLLLYENVELRAKKTSFVLAVAEKESLNIDINSAKSKLN